MTNNEKNTLDAQRAAPAAAAATPEQRGEPAAASRSTTPEGAPPAVADGLDHPLDPRVVPLGRLVGWIVAITVSPALLIAIGVSLWLTPLPRWAAAALWLLGGAVTVGLAWLAQGWPAVEYRHSSYKVDARGIEIRRGVLWREVLNVPRSRVQHTDVSQGPLERGYGLGTLVIYTAGSDYARVELRGLDHAGALRIRDHLLPGEGGDAV